MEQIILNLKDSSKLSFLLQLIKQLDFVEIEKIKKRSTSNKHDFFNSAGLWADRDLSAKKLREQAWNRKK